MTREPARIRAPIVSTATHRRGLAAALLAVVLGLGCAQCSTRTETAHERKAGVASRAQRPTAPAPAATPPTAVRPADLGYDGVPPLPSDEARAANSQGLETHRNGQFVQSRALFERALAAAPTYTLARFNLACALARQGDPAAARTELVRAAKEDPPDTIARFRKDEDLAALRADASLVAELERIHAALASAVTSGLPVFLPVEEKAWACGGMGDQCETVLRPARAGVFLVDARRFVPITPIVPGATTGLIDRARSRVLMVLAQNQFCSEYCFAPLLSGATLFDVRNPSEPIISLPRRLLDTVNEFLLQEAYSLEVANTENAVHVRFADHPAPGQAPPWRSLRAAATDASHRRGFEEAPWPDDLQALGITSMRTYRTLTAGPLRFERGTLRGAGFAPFRLRREHRRDGTHRVYSGPRAGIALLVSEWWARVPSDECSQRWTYAVDFVDLATASTTRVTNGHGNPHYNGDSVPEEVITADWIDGRWLIQIGRALHVWREGEAMTQLVSGLAIEPPYAYANDSGC